jgi:hypothetical protein
LREDKQAKQQIDGSFQIPSWNTQRVSSERRQEHQFFLR